MFVNGGKVSECVKRWLHSVYSLIFFVAFVVNDGTVAAAMVEACTLSVCGVSQFLDV
jgi:hypothetical protein